MFLAFHGMNHYTGPRQSACTLATRLCTYSRGFHRVSIPRCIPCATGGPRICVVGSSPARERERESSPLLWLRPYFWLNHPAKYGCVILGGTMSMPAQILPAAEIGGATMDNRPPPMTHHHHHHHHHRHQRDALPI